MKESKCPQCGNVITKPDTIRCPRCNKLLLTPCSGNCRRCKQKGQCRSDGTK